MLPRDVVLDASLLVAGIRPGELYYHEARRAVETLTRERVNLFAPAIVLAEVAAAIARGSGSADQAARDVQLVRRLAGLQIVAVGGTLADLAARVAAQQHLRGCDAVYVALAQQQRAVLITLDNEQRQRAPATVSAWTPIELLAHWESA